MARFIDERGVVVGLQPELIDAIARHVAHAKQRTTQKVYCIGQTFQPSANQAIQYEKMKLAPKGTTNACIALLNPGAEASRSEI